MALAVVLMSCRPKDTCDNCGNSDLMPPLGLAFSIPSGDASFFDPVTHEIVRQVPLEDWPVVCAEVHPSADLIVVGDGVFNRIAMMTLPSLEIIGSELLGGTPVDVNLSPSGLQVYALTRNGNFWVVTLGSGDIDTLDVGVFARRMAFRPPGHYVWIACPGDHAIYVLDLVHLTRIDSLAFPDPPTDVAFSFTGNQAFVAFQGDPGYFLVMNAESRAIIESHNLGLGAFDLAVSPNGKYLAATDSAEGTVHIWDEEADTLWTMNTDSDPMRVRFADDNYSFFTLSYAGERILHFRMAETGPVIVDTVYVNPSVYDFVLWESHP